MSLRRWLPMLVIMIVPATAYTHAPQYEYHVENGLADYAEINDSWFWVPTGVALIDKMDATFERSQKWNYGLETWIATEGTLTATFPNGDLSCRFFYQEFGDQHYATGHVRVGDQTVACSAVEIKMQEMNAFAQEMLQNTPLEDAYQDGEEEQDICDILIMVRGEAQDHRHRFELFAPCTPP